MSERSLEMVQTAGLIVLGVVIGLMIGVTLAAIRYREFYRAGWNAAYTQIQVTPPAYIPEVDAGSSSSSSPLAEQDCTTLNWGNPPKYAQMSKFEALTSRPSEYLTNEERKPLKKLIDCQNAK